MKHHQPPVGTHSTASPKFSGEDAPTFALESLPPNVAQASHLHVQSRLLPRQTPSSQCSRDGCATLGAFTRVELLAVIGAIALLMIVAVSAQSRPREFGQRVTCVNNLRQIARGCLMWAGEHGGSGPPTVSAADGGTKGNQNLYAHFLVASNEIGSPRMLVCPSDTVQWIAADWAQFDSPPFRNNAVSYFAGMHVSAENTPVMLAGDPNLLGTSASSCGIAVIRVASFDYQLNALSWDTRRFHLDSGNMAFADGRVAQLTTDGLRKLRVPVFNDGGNYEHLLLPP